MRTLLLAALLAPALAFAQIEIVSEKPRYV